MMEISPPEPALLRRILRLTGDGLRMMTITPELKGCGPVLKLLVKSGCIASLGHSNATYEEAVEALAGDITHVTHLFNAMPLLHHRQPGPILAIMESRATVQVIPDGVHLHPRVLRWAWDQLGEDRMNLITDGIRATGLPEGEYEYDGVKFRAIEGAARYQNGTLTGTTLGMDELVRRAVRYTGCTLEEGIGMASRNPARVLGLADRKGAISEGRDADLVLLDQEGVRLTIVSGRVVHERS